MSNSIKLGDTVYLDTCKDYTGIVTKIINTTIWVNNTITGFLLIDGKKLITKYYDYNRIK